MQSTIRALGSAAILSIALGCAASDLLEPVLTESTLIYGQIRVTLDVAPERLQAPGTILATLTYENLGNETVVLSSAYGCLSFASVYRGEERIPFPATQYGCTAAVSHRDLKPGEPITMQWPLVVGGETGLDAPPGTYRFVADLNTHGYDLAATFVLE